MQTYVFQLFCIPTHVHNFSHYPLKIYAWANQTIHRLTEKSYALMYRCPPLLMPPLLLQQLKCLLSINHPINQIIRVWHVVTYGTYKLHVAKSRLIQNLGNNVEVREQKQNKEPNKKRVTSTHIGSKGVKRTKTIGTLSDGRKHAEDSSTEETHWQLAYSEA